MLSTLQMVNLGLRALMELGIVVALGYWGYQTGNSTPAKILLGIGAPLIGFGVWGLLDFRQAGVLAKPLRLMQELVISGFAALAWYVAGAQIWGWALGVLSVVHHIFVYLSGERLLKQ